MQRIILFICVLGALLLNACVTRHIPEGNYLLDKKGVDHILIMPDTFELAKTSSSLQKRLPDTLSKLTYVPFTLDSLGYLFKPGKYPGSFPGRKKHLEKGTGKVALAHSVGNDVDKWDMEDIFKQKPNRTILGGIKFHTWMYLKVDTTKAHDKALKKFERLIQKNERRRTRDVHKVNLRLLRGKEPKEDPIRPPKTYKPTWRERILNSIGEAPVYIDTGKTSTTRKQINTYMIKKGYFNSHVRDTVIKHPRKRKAAVYYIIEPERPYVINKITREIDDPDLLRYVDRAIKSESVLKEGQVFDISKLSRERSMVEDYLQNRGYYGFSKDYIYYEVDSVVYTVDSQRLHHVVNVTMGVSQITKHVTVDSLTKEDHTRFSIRNVYVFENFNPEKGTNIANYDTMTHDGLIMAYQGKFRVRPHILADRIFIKPDYTYRKKEAEATYRQLSNLGVFRGISVKFKPLEDEGLDEYMDCYIVLTPSMRQSFSTETNGTNRAGNLGINGSLSYTNRNLFRAAEKMSIAVSGGLEIQQLLSDNDSTVLGVFNTVEFGPSLSFDFPRIFFWPKEILGKRQFKSWDHTATDISASFNFQQRPDYTRAIQEVSIHLEGVKKSKHTFKLGVLQLSALDIRRQSPEFLATLAALNDPVLNTSFTDHIISASSFSYTYNDQDPQKKLKNVGYYKGDLEWAGNILHEVAERSLNGTGLGSFLNLAFDSTTNSYTLFGTRFAQYVKTFHDFRYYFRHNSKDETAVRVAFGVGRPGANLADALPFERAFYGGGANSVRAWRARTLGPGGFTETDTEDRFDKIGDIQLEINLEYRFDLFDVVEGAFFADAGNVWLWNNSIARPKGQFEIKDFHKEIGIGVGFGLRVDLDFFIVRLDMATIVKDPSRDERYRWMWGKLHEPYWGGVNFNFGIGYPF